MSSHFSRAACRVLACVLTVVALFLGSMNIVMAKDLSVISDIAPVHSLIARVMQGVGEPEIIMSRGANPHSYSLRPSEAGKLNHADVLFWVGPNLTPWLNKAVTALGDGTVSIELMQAEGATLLDNRDDAAFSLVHEHHDHNHDHPDSEIDPHAWLDPENGKLWLGIIAEQLARLDPVNADTYKRNALAGQSEIDSAIVQMRKRLDGAAQGRYIVFHDAYQYFAARFEVPAVGAISLSDASRPSAARISEIGRVFTEADVQCVVAEPLYNEGLLNSVIGRAPVRVTVIDPLAMDFPLSPQLYIDWQLATAEQLAQCLLGSN